METTGRENFIEAYQLELRNVLSTYPEIETTNHLHGLPGMYLEKLLSLRPQSLFIPKKFGGRGGETHHCLALLEAASYESIAVGLMLGINGSLFLEPVTKYCQEEAKIEIFKAFLSDISLGGLMITEPDFGTDALSMQTSYSQSKQNFLLKGNKHWGGLTGLANFWIVTARKERKANKLARDIDLFVVDRSQPGQTITVEEYYDKLGLFLIPYGLNNIDATVPATAKLIPHSSGLKLMMDLLHRSRLRLSAIGLGFIRRMLDEAVEHCQHRFVGGKSLLSYDQVRHRISRLQAWFTIASAICRYAAGVSSISNNLTSFGLQANGAKAILTDMMQDSAQSLLQLKGAQGYRRDHIAGRAVADSRPFQIFEGSNDVMYSQVADIVLKKMRDEKEHNFLSLLSRFDQTRKGAGYFKELLNFNLDFNSVQRTRVTLGKIIAKIIVAEFTFELYESGFRKELVDNALIVTGNDIAGLAPSLAHSQLVNVVEDYQEKSDWKSSYDFLNC